MKLKKFWSGGAGCAPSKSATETVDIKVLSFVGT